MLNGIAEAEAPTKQFDSTTSVLVADFIVPSGKQTPSSGQLTVNCEKYRHIVEQYEWDVEIVLAIMKAESGCDTFIVNDNPATEDYSIGLMQINIYGTNAKYRPSEETLKIPEKNIAYAYLLWKSSGFQSQWGVCRNGKVNCK